MKVVSIGISIAISVALTVRKMLLSPPHQNMVPRWQAFFESWAIRVLCYPVTEKLAAFATRGVTDKTPRLHRWFGLFIVAAVTAFAIAVVAAGEVTLLRYMTGSRPWWTP